MKQLQLKPLQDFKSRANKTIIYAFIAGMAFVVMAKYLYVYLDNKYDVRSPVVFQNPVVLAKEPVTPTTTPTSTPTTTPTPTTSPKYNKRSYSGTQDLDRLVLAVAKAESGNGTAKTGHHRYCEGIGKTNIYGYGNRQKFCFDNEEVARLTIYNWYAKRLNAGTDLKTALCEYNIGVKTDNCDYITLISKFYEII